MATKYVDVSQAFNGDGTLWTPAASPGAPGAFNVLEATILTRVAGDKLEVRTADSGGNLGENWGAFDFRAVAGTPAAPIIIHFDDGTIWPEAGVFEITITKTTCYLPRYTHFIGADATGTKRAKMTHTGGVGSLEIRTGTAGDYFGECLIQGMLFDPVLDAANDSSIDWRFRDPSNIFPAVFLGCEFHFRNWGYSGREAFVGNLRLFDCKLVGHAHPVYAPVSGDMLAKDGAYFGGCDIDFSISEGNGTLINAMPLAEAVNASTSIPQQVVFDGCRVRGWDFNSQYISVSGSELFAESKTHISIQDALADYGWCFADGRSLQAWQPGKAYPTLNARLLDGSTPWSILVELMGGASRSAVTRLPAFAKRITTTGTYTATVEFLYPVGAPTPTADAFWIDVSFEDASGNHYTVSSFDSSGAEVATSTASWSGYSAGAHSKRKLVVALPVEVPADTRVHARLSIASPTLGAQTYMYVDPDVFLAAV